MEHFGTKKNSAIRKRVKKAHSKAGFAGTLYLLGALAIAVLAFLSGFEHETYGAVGITNFYLPVQDALAGAPVWTDVIVMGLYLVLLLVVVVNFFKCFSKLGWLTRRSSRYVNGYNRNMRAMEKMGKYFSSSFAAFVSIYALLLLNPAIALPVMETMTFMMMLAAVGVGLFVHFVAGLIAGKVSWFDTYGNGGNVEEVKRECGIFVYFFRNLVQIAAVVGVLWFFYEVDTIGATVGSWLGGVNPLEGDLLQNVLPVALEAVLVLCLLVLIKHATAATEFNRQGIEGIGMKNYRVFAFLLALVAGGVIAVNMFVFQIEEISMQYVYIAAIAFVAFLVDCIFKTREKKEEEDYDPLENGEQENGGTYPMLPMQPMMPTAQPTAIYPQAPTQQPVYIPVYYPYPLQQPYPVPSAPMKVEAVVKGLPASASTPAAPTVVAAKAPEHIKPEPSPAEKARQDALEKENAEPVEIKTLNPNKEWQVRCPRCGKLLNVRDTSPYHRCPSCDKVFQLRKFQAYVRKEQ